VGAVVGGVGGAIVGGIVGGTGGTFVEPGGGTLVGIGLGGTEGAKDGAALGALIGATLGVIYSEAKDAVSGPKAADAPGVTAGGQATDAGCPTHFAIFANVWVFPDPHASHSRVTIPTRDCRVCGRVAI